LQIFIAEILSAIEIVVNNFKLTTMPILIDKEKVERLFVVTRGQKKYKVVTIINELGLHARSAAQIAKTAGNSTANVWLKKGDKIADAASIIDILTLACEKGTRITILIENWADIDILKDIVDLVESGFGE
jgi:phosphocarrier protein